ncbi:glycosyltransferase family 2 protein [Photobacterium nomapromontoriensis]|uniref:glycosyltransferase family 2 protein n=1 Tax=Photobacterium nomapromontoriensis TaxID=2910237 RepID=UPI003D09D125
MTAISIVVNTHNEEKRIGRLLDDLNKQSHQHFEVIVIDSNSEDKTCDVARGFGQALPTITVKKLKQHGVSFARNVGAQLAKYERLLFLDADVRLTPTFLSDAIYQLEKKKVDIAGAYMKADNLSLGYHLGYTAINTGLFVTSFFFPTIVGACMFSTQRVHREIGGFNENITQCGECDYTRRAAQTWRYRMIPVSFGFDPSRLRQNGWIKMAATYLKANIALRFY